MSNTEVIAQAQQKINIIVRDWWTQWGGRKVSRDFISSCCSRAMRREEGMV